MIILSIRFRSALTSDEVRARMRERSEQFRALPQLLQKYYTQDTSTGDWNGIYLWDSAAAVEAFLASELAHSMTAAYQVTSTPRVEILEVHFTLRENSRASSL